MKLEVWVLLVVAFAKSLANNYDSKVEQWLNDVNNQYQMSKRASKRAEFNWATNITDANAEARLKADVAGDKLRDIVSANASTFDLKQVTNPNLKRELEVWRRMKFSLPPDEFTELNEIVKNMSTIYGSAKVCAKDFANCEEKWSLTPELENVLETSTDYDLLAYVWKEWRTQTGGEMRDSYKRYIELLNKGAQAVGFNDYGDKYRIDFESDDPNFRESMEKLWSQILPLYEELHTYVRSKLSTIYAGKVDKVAPMPAHLLGNMWAQSWEQIRNKLLPYPEAQKSDLDEKLKELGYTVKRLFETGEDFFVSLGLPKLNESFWNVSMLEKPKDGREVLCHAYAYDFYNSKDFAIKMCTKINMRDFDVIHHEFGHVYYYIAYKDQASIFREGANTGFHEAIGDTMFLSGYATSYLKSRGLVTGSVSAEEQLNRLMHLALNFIPFYPFGYLIDLYRWDVFSGKTSTENLNSAWWDLREKYQGVIPPVPRSEQDFDPGAKYHVAANVAYIRYYVARILVFQFHEALCKEVDPALPPHECSIYGNKKAGEKLWETLQLGSTKPWPDALELMTGQREMTAEPLRKYFKPLQDWLEAENKRLGNCYGWGAKWPDSYQLKEPRCVPAKHSKGEKVDLQRAIYMLCAMVLFCLI